MFIITKEFSFEASHQIFGLPEGHQCSRMHGHSYRVEVVIKSPCLDARGFAQVDYGELAPFKAYLDAHFDHRHLNDLIPQPTAERIAEHLFKEARKISFFVCAVRVSETAKTWATYESPN
jgi:6-pyruvoyltetrahydropterin/6-carboxytetrahydropterin synthase